MNYTAEEKELIVKWRPYYEKLISDAIQRVVQKEKELIPSYYSGGTGRTEYC